jgi:hypothetical protein
MNPRSGRANRHDDVMQYRTLMSILALALAVAACTGEIVGESVVARPELRQPAAEGDLIDVTVEPDALVLRYAGPVPAFHAGDLVWGTEGPGYLRKVTGVDAEAEVVRLATVAADVGDGFEQIHVDGAGPTAVPQFTMPVARDERLSLTGADGIAYAVHVRYAQPTFVPTPLTGGATFAWEIPELSIEITDPSGHGALTLSARSLRVEKTVALDAGVHWAWGKLQSLRFLVDDHTTYSLQQLAIAVDGTVPLVNQAIPLLHDPALATVPVGPFVFTLGGTIDLGLDAVLSASGELHTTSDVSLATSSHSGVIWDGSFHPIDEHAATVDVDAGPIAVGDRTHATLAADVSILGTLRFALWGVAGPELYGQITPVAADLTTDLHGWHLDLAANASGGLRFVLPFVTPDQLDVDFGRWDQTYYQTSGSW